MDIIKQHNDIKCAIKEIDNFIVLIYNGLIDSQNEEKLLKDNIKFLKNDSNLKETERVNRLYHFLTDIIYNIAFFKMLIVGLISIVSIYFTKLTNPWIIVSLIGFYPVYSIEKRLIFSAANKLFKKYKKCLNSSQEIIDDVNKYEDKLKLQKEHTRDFKNILKKLVGRKRELNNILLRYEDKYQRAIIAQNYNLYNSEEIIEEKEPVEFKIEEGKVLDKVLSQH